MAEANKELLQNLIEFGIEKDAATRALIATKNTNVDAALEWYDIKSFGIQ